MGETSDTSREDARRMHARIDEIVAISGEIRGDVREIKASCKPCQKQVAQHKTLLYGNSDDKGLKTEVTMMRQTWRNVGRGMWALCAVVLTLAGKAVKNVMGW